MMTDNHSQPTLTTIDAALQRGRAERSRAFHGFLHWVGESLSRALQMPAARNAKDAAC